VGGGGGGGGLGWGGMVWVGDDHSHHPDSCQQCVPLQSYPVMLFDFLTTSPC
jgi:hypothetical protein